MRFSLRTLVLAMLLGGPLCAWGWREWQAYQARRREAEFEAIIELITSTVAPQSWDSSTTARITFKAELQLLPTEERETTRSATTHGGEAGENLDDPFK